MKTQILHLLVLVIILSAGARLFAADAATAPTAAPVKTDIAISVVTEDKQQLIQAIVTANGKPVENAMVSIGVKRTFGVLKLKMVGGDKTIDDGSAAAEFPDKLPGDASGQLRVIAQVTAPPQYITTAEATVAGGMQPMALADPYPRALWAPHAPWWLVATISFLLVGVWTTYLFVISQVVAIFKGAKS